MSAALAPAPAPPPAPPGVCRAVVDVGTNSVKLLVARVRGAEVIPVFERAEQTRLGRGFYEDHRLRPEAVRHTAQAVAGFVHRARELGASAIRVLATSAVRDAVNSAELTDALSAATGLPVEVISGEVEAAMAFRGVCTDPGLAGRPLLVMDLGGGSTEFIVGRDGAMSWSSSSAATARCPGRTAFRWAPCAFMSRCSPVNGRRRPCSPAAGRSWPGF
ncbi:MAG TPA: diol dehydratase reactivase ATPase-like domain-containing protein [Verrucomicrobiota bacterium]|nr:diol dehydratase reactivase ATPase-like domain-containing protein [Verrucomicrobiota bacterium]